MPSVLAAYEEVQPGLRYKGVDVACSVIDDVKSLSSTHPNWCAARAAECAVNKVYIALGMLCCATSRQHSCTPPCNAPWRLHACSAHADTPSHA